MKKTTRNLLIMLAVLAVLGGAAAALLLLPAQPAQGDSPQTSSAESRASSDSAQETVMERAASDVASVIIEQGGESYMFLPTEEGFTIDGCEQYDLLTSSMNLSVNSLLTIHSQKNLGSRDNLEDFGLAGDRAVEVEIDYTDGGFDRLVLGDKAGESLGRYLLKDGSVYIVTTLAEALYGGKFGYFSTELYTVPDRTEETVGENGESSAETLADILYHLKLSGANFPQPIEIAYDDSVLNLYLMMAPLTAESGTGTFLDDIIPALKAPSAAAVAAAGLTPELLEEYGLAEPAAVAEFDMNNNRHSLSVSRAEGGSRYLLLDDRDVIYRIADSEVSSWADAGLMDLRMTYIWLANIMDVQQLGITAGDKSYRFSAEKSLDEEKSTEDNPSYVLTLQNADGLAIDYANYQNFYKQLIAIAVLNVDRPDYGGNPDYAVEYRFFEDGETDTVAFYAVGEDRYAVELNGGFNGQVRRSEVDKVFGILEGLNQNKAAE